MNADIYWCILREEPTENISGARCGLKSVTWFARRSSLDASLLSIYNIYLFLFLFLSATQQVLVLRVVTCNNLNSVECVSKPAVLSLSLFLASVISDIGGFSALSRGPVKEKRLGRAMLFAWRDYGVTPRSAVWVGKGEARLTPIRSANRRPRRHLVRCNGASHPRGRRAPPRSYFGRKTSVSKISCYRQTSRFSSSRENLSANLSAALLSPNYFVVNPAEKNCDAECRAVSESPRITDLLAVSYSKWKIADTKRSIQHSLVNKSIIRRSHMGMSAARLQWWCNPMLHRSGNVSENLFTRNVTRRVASRVNAVILWIEVACSLDRDHRRRGEYLRIYA